MAEMEILERLGIEESAFSGLTAKAQFKGKNGMKYYAASLILPSLSQIISDTVFNRVLRYEVHPLETKIERYENVTDVQVPKDPTRTTTTGDVTYASLLTGR